MMQLIAELGGAGAITSGVFRMFAMFAKQGQEVAKYKAAALAQDRDWLQKSRDTFQESIKQTGPFAHSVLTIVSAITLLAPVLIPLFSDYVTVHYFIPKSGSFLTLTWESWKDLSVGPESIPAGKTMKHIAIYPIQISLCANQIAFFLVGRSLKH